MKLAKDSLVTPHEASRLSGTMLQSWSYDVSNIIFTSCLASLSYLIYLVLLRLYFGPLSHIPGPKISALTVIPAYYHDVVRGGQYLWEIEKMHKRYGPIIRSKPDLVHINDPAFLDELYTGPKRIRHKTEFFCNGVPNFKDKVAFSVQDHVSHRLKRTPLNSFFSKSSIRRMEPIIQDKIDKLFLVLSKCADTGNLLRMKILYVALTNDVITEYSFGKSWDSLSADDLNVDFFDNFQSLTKSFHVNCYHPWLFFFIISLPGFLLRRLAPALELVGPYMKRLRRQTEIIADVQVKEGSGPPTVIRELLDSDLPEAEKSIPRLAMEGQHLLAGGTDSTAHILTAVTYHLLASPPMLAKLKQELQVAIPDKESMPSCAILETLPYLNAVLKEAFRLHPPATFCMERIAPEEDLAYKSPYDGKTYIIPRGTAIGMTLPLLGRIESLYPDHNVFRPERWIENPELNKLFMPFGRGTRRCLGENLASAELYMVCCALFRRVDSWDGSGKTTGLTLELYETDRRDVDTAAARITAFIDSTRKGVRVIVRD